MCFKKQVFEFVRNIPKGKVATYGLIASAVGTGPRAVGNILHTNVDPVNYPCHRVVRWDGGMASGYVFGGPENQRMILEEEGVIFKGLKVDLDQSLWME